jgi:hypothetical protein
MTDPGARRPIVQTQPQYNYLYMQPCMDMQHGAAVGWLDVRQMRLLVAWTPGSLRHFDIISLPEHATPMPAFTPSTGAGLTEVPGVSVASTHLAAQTRCDGN